MRSEYRYIAKPAACRKNGAGWFSSYTEAVLYEDYRPELDAGLFDGFKRDIDRVTPELAEDANNYIESNNTECHYWKRKRSLPCMMTLGINWNKSNRKFSCSRWTSENIHSEVCEFEEFWEIHEDDFFTYIDRLVDFAISRAIALGWKKSVAKNPKTERPILVPPGSYFNEEMSSKMWRTHVIDGEIVEIPYMISEVYVGIEELIPRLEFLNDKV